MKEQILFVDDDADILASMKMNLRKMFKVETALSGLEGLDILAKSGPFPVVVSDMRMPGMNGAQFLSEVKQRTPDSVRILLTGQADMQDTISAVNNGHIFRFLAKPCPPDVLVTALNDGVKQYRLITAERELLDKTLNGSIKVLIEILALEDPQSFKYAIEQKKMIRELSQALKLPNAWELEIATMLQNIGQVTIPPAIIIKHKRGQALSKDEQGAINSIPLAGYNLLKNIPRLEVVSNIILYKNKYYNGMGSPKDDVKEDKIPLGARLLKIVNDLFEIKNNNVYGAKIFDILESRKGRYDPILLGIARTCFIGTTGKKDNERSILDLKFTGLKPGHLLLSDITTKDGTMLVSKGERLTRTMLLRLENWNKIYGIEEPIQVAAE